MECVIKVGTLLTTIDSTELSQDILNVIFGSHYMVQVGFIDGKYKVLNAMDGYGNNCRNEFKDYDVTFFIPIQQGLGIWDAGWDRGHDVGLSLEEYTKCHNKQAYFKSIGIDLSKFGQ